MATNPNIQQNISPVGQVASYEELQQLVYTFKEVLKGLGVPIKPGSELEKGCCAVLDVLGNSQQPHIGDPQEDIRHIFREVLGIWLFLRQIVRLQGHVNFSTFVPHLALLNKGTVIQNSQVRVCSEATNKIFELLLALALLDLSDEVVLDHPDLAKGDNPDILATIDGRCWGFACKTIYGSSGKTFFDRLEEGVLQIEAAPKAQVGAVVMNFRNIINQDKCWPILNEAEYRNGAEPKFTAYDRPGEFVRGHIEEAVTQKHGQVIAEIGLPDIKKLFGGKKALPGFLAYCPTSTGHNTDHGPVPRSVNMLGVGWFGDPQPYLGIIEKINSALHECIPR